MFYSETLLSKTGPLARVWLSANLERKLSKNHVLSSDIGSSVNAIVDTGAAPMALRLSGQLLLGVVRIYSRKARYLLDDCNEALLRIKMAFRPGNVDLPANMNMPSTAALTIEDRITDPILPELDPSLLDFQPQNLKLNSKRDNPLEWNSQLVPDASAIEIGRRESVRDPRTDFDEEAMNIDLDLDLGLDDGPSLELGRKAPNVDMIDNLDDDGFLPGELGDKTRASSQVPSLIADGEQQNGDNRMLLEDDDLQLHPSVTAADLAADPRLQRDSQSPLSSRHSSLARDFEAAQGRQAAHRPKKRRVLQEDSNTVLSSERLKSQQADRSAILKPLSFLSRDPFVFNLLNLRRNGNFVTQIMEDDITKRWAPELRDLLSLESVRKSGELKRKRDSGVADVGEDDMAGLPDKAPGLELPDETFGALDDGADIFHDRAEETAEGHRQILLGNDTTLNNAAEGDAAADRFDDTVAPLLHPSEQGAVSQGTRHAVHILREHFGGREGQNASQSKKSQLFFQELQPQDAIKKADATKMFFEILVLATKDAIKVDQGEKEIGEDIRIRAKRGLWGSWAEQDAGGELEKNETNAVALTA